MTPRPLVFVSGPYTHPDPVLNTRRAIEVGEDLEHLGCDVFIPHLTLLWHLVAPAKPERWYERDNVILTRCDAVYRFEGDSAGADAEVRLAQTRAMPVFFELREIGTWVDCMQLARP